MPVIIEKIPIRVKALASVRLTPILSDIYPLGNCVTMYPTQKPVMSKPACVYVSCRALVIFGINGGYMVLGIHEIINEIQAKARMTQRYFNPVISIPSIPKLLAGFCDLAPHFLRVRLTIPNPPIHNYSQNGHI